MTSYRPQSTAKWYNLPGIVAAYQPIAAPDPIASCQNIGMGKLGRYTATPKVMPTWASARGWSFDGTTQHLFSYIPAASVSSWIARYSGAGADTAPVLGCFDETGPDVTLYPKYTDNNQYMRVYGKTFSRVAPADFAGAVAGATTAAAYWNGINIGAMSNGTTFATNTTVILGGLGSTAAPPDALAAAALWAGSIKAVVICSRPLSSTEIFMASWQMKYCDVNPEWNVWARQRQYWMMYTEAAPSYGQKLLFAEQTRVMME